MEFIEISYMKLYKDSSRNPQYYSCLAQYVSPKSMVLRAQEELEDEPGHSRGLRETYDALEQRLEGLKKSGIEIY